jgi:hypothetical protein
VPACCRRRCGLSASRFPGPGEDHAGRASVSTGLFSIRTALLWEGYDLGLESIAMDVLHGTLDTSPPALGRPERITAFGVANDAGGSAAEILLTHPGTLVGCSASALMPRPYGVRGGCLATFSHAVLESSWTAAGTAAPPEPSPNTPTGAPESSTYPTPTPTPP